VVKFIFDRLAALLGIVILSPLFICLAAAVAIDSRGGAFFVQQRVGRDGRLFGIYKFRTMRPFSEKEGKLTVGSRDPRVTRVGYVLRVYKLDELPQLFNVLLGDMSLVGPRPEVPGYVALYTPSQRRVLEVRPGITDYASLRYFHESELLARSADPEQTYINEVMPNKLALNLEYIERRSFFGDIKILLATVSRIFT
jgi:lipopolysaccharide/colanic/teichoic acid biosynthesis glycosyltransferase